MIKFFYYPFSSPYLLYPDKIIQYFYSIFIRIISWYEQNSWKKLIFDIINAIDLTLN